MKALLIEMSMLVSLALGMRVKWSRYREVSTRAMLKSVWMERRRRVSVFLDVELKFCGGEVEVDLMALLTYAYGFGLFLRCVGGYYCGF